MSLEHRRSRIFNRIILLLATFLVAKKALRTIALLMSWSLAFKCKGNSANGKKPYKAVFLMKSVFADDITQGLAPLRRLTLYEMDRRVLKSLVRPFLPYDVHDNSYKNDDEELAEAKQKAREFFEQLVPRFLKASKIDAILTGNVVYWAEQEFSGVVDANGVAFIACHKESIQAPKLYDELMALRKVGNDPFQGTAVAVYNQHAYDQLVDGGIVPADRISITGAPRFDRFHQFRMSKTDPKRKIVCLLVSKISQLRCLIDPEDELRWDRIADFTHRRLIQIALANPSIQLTFKAKPTDLQQVNGLKSLLGIPSPANIKVVLNQPLYEVLKDASVVVGHNTTAILEAMAMGKTCVLPHYEEATSSDFEGRLIDFGDGVIKAHNPDELEELVMGVLTNQNQPIAYDKRHQTKLDQWVGNADGEASFRFFQLIESEIIKKKQMVNN